MYCEFFGFKEQPFSITPNPRFIYLSKNHREAFAHLLYGIESHAGFIELTGEVGTGKTTILRSLLNQLDDTKHRTALIFNPRLSADELLRTINREFGILASGTIDELMHALNQFLLSENAASRTVVLVIDESQNLDPSVLEQIRMISNLETDTDKLIQIILAGQPELGEMLESEKLRQLNQRIKVRYHLPHLDFEDMVSYIDHRLEIAGGWKAATFQAGALDKIFKYSRGLPRLINVLCDRALLIAYTDETREISSKTVKQAIRELKRDRLSSSSSSNIRKSIAVALITVSLVAAGYFAGRNNHPEQTSSSSATPALQPVRSEALINLETTLRNDTGNASEMDCAIQSFNILADLWGIRSVNEYKGNTIKRGLELVSLRRGLKLLTLEGAEPADIVRGDTPCLIEVKIPETKLLRLIPLTGFSEGNFNIVAPFTKKSFSINEKELKTVWTGVAYIPWSNHLNIPDSIREGSDSAGISKMQQMLFKTGHLSGKATGIMNKATKDAIRKFQAEAQIKADGIPGSRTLMLLYRSSGETVSPSLKNRGRTI